MGVLSSHVEWAVSNGQYDKEGIACGPHVRCFGILRVWMYTSTGKWFQLELPGSWMEVHITVKELLLIVVGVAMWGPPWKGLTICCQCDNAAVVTIVNSAGLKWTGPCTLCDACLSSWPAGK